MTDVPLGAVGYRAFAVWTMWNARRRLRQARDGAFDQMDPPELEGIRQTFKGAWPRWVQALVVAYPVVLGLVLWTTTPFSALYVVLAAIFATAFRVHDATRVEIMDVLGDRGAGAQVAPRPSSARRRTWTLRFGLLAVVLAGVASLAPVLGAGSGGGWVVAVAGPAALLAVGAAGWAWVWVYGDEAEPDA